MNILHINKLDVIGGAARAMYRLHQGLNDLGHQSQVLVGHQALREPGIDCIDKQARPFRTLKDKIWDRINKRLKNPRAIYRLSRRNSWHIPQTPAFRQADVVNLHNVRDDYLNFRALPELARRKPVVWTLHDMWPLTGHCAYSYDCQRWRSGCFECPLLEEPGRQIVEPAPTPVDRTRTVWRAKRRVYQEILLHIVTPSKWLQDLVKRSILAESATVHRVPYGVNVDIFRPLDREVARKALDLPLDARVVLGCGVRQGRKGFSYLWQALEKLPERDSILLLISEREPALGRSPAPFPIRELNHSGDDRLQRIALTAADLFVLPSLADNLPLALIESLACGTPVVAIDVGGVPEIVRHMETGYLARYKDVDDLSRGVRMLLNDHSTLIKMSRRCREIAESEYSLKRQVKRYLEIYEQAIKCRPS